MTLDEAIEALRAAWPEHGCGAGDCCLRRPGGQVVGTCRCVRDWKDHPGDLPVYRLLDAARRVIEAPHESPPSLDAALAVLVDRAATQAESGTGEVARPLREAVARLLPSMRILGPWEERGGSWARWQAGVEGLAPISYTFGQFAATAREMGEFEGYISRPRFKAWAGEWRLFDMERAARAACDEWATTKAGWVIL